MNSTFSKSQLFVFSLLAFILSIAACNTTGSLKGNSFERGKLKYNVGLPGTGWKKIHLSGADIAWFDPQHGSTILVNSQCKKERDLPLKALTVELLLGLTEQRILEQQLLPWSNREALETVATAKLDGVPRKLKMFVLKKNGCVFDIVFGAPPKAYNQGLKAFETVRDQFDTKATR
jgi:hypothetical protein